MTKPALICPHPPTTTTGVGKSHARELPYDILQEATRRLAIISLLGAILWLLGTVFYHLAIRQLAPHNPDSTFRFTASDIISEASAAISLAVFFYARKTNRDPRFVLDLGLVYMVFTSLALSLVIHWDPFPSGAPVMPMITWVGAVILMFAAILPNSPRKILIAGLISASMNPLAMYVGYLRGTWPFGVSSTIAMHYPDFLLVGVAVVISRVMTRLGQQVTKAREMGSYQLVSKLGAGGMGEVWRASHRMLARDAAIKLIQPGMLSGQAGRNATLIQRRFEQEARATAQLRSPHTVELYDFGVTEDGVFYYVMELLDGIDLETLVKKFGPQPPARVAGILRQVCLSLGDAHRQGMIHRDIKPTNIFLCRMGNQYDFAKVLDFGLVKVLDSNETAMTGEGATTGTPAYMAPEVALGNAIDGRTDLYGLGCVAYWLLTGSLVFEEKGATATMLAHVQKAPLPPSEKSEAAIPEGLERAILMCLEKNPAARPATAEALKRLLDRGGDLGAWTDDDAERWWQINVPVNPNTADRGEEIERVTSLETL
ncbi:MAG: serine/threonine-protein kinase [Candidatus Solibacter sp.]